MQNVKDKKYLKALGVNIKRLRKLRNLTQLELAVMMDNHPEQISRIERGLHNVTICSLKKIAEVLDVSVSELLPE
ncbi:MAG: helix-turn-helix transcriptional regulator [Chitinophagaceae bacterium]